MLDKIYNKPQPRDSEFPEEWILSTTKTVNTGREDIEEGLCYLADKKISLKQLIEDYPREMLGDKHFADYDANMGVLIKLIDSKARLPMQVHPDKNTSMRLFNSRFGKTECWHILDIRNDSAETPCLYMGFRDNTTREKWEKCFEQQDIKQMLSCLNKIDAKPGETYIIKGGVPHAIGAGCFLIEIQEPTDLTIRLEKTTPSGIKIDGAACHQGLGYKLMFDCFDYTCKTKDQILDEWRIQSMTMLSAAGNEIKRLIGYETTDCFMINEVTVKDHLELPTGNVFSGFYVMNGHGYIQCYNGDMLNVTQNDQFFIPALCTGVTLRSAGNIPMRLFWFFGPQINHQDKKGSI